VPCAYDTGTDMEIARRDMAAIFRIGGAFNMASE
jgi:hypothetical protein